MESLTSVISGTKEAVEPDIAASVNSSKIQMETGWSLWRLFLSVLVMVVFGTMAGDLIRGNIPRIDVTTLSLWMSAPIVVGVSTIVHEYIHAYTAKHLLNGKDVQIKFSLLGGTTHAMVNQNAALWRHLVCTVSPAIICAVLGIVGTLATIIASVFLPDSWGGALNGIAAAMLMSAGVNLFNLLPVGNLDGGHARREIMSSWKESRRARKSVAVAAA